MADELKTYSVWKFWIGFMRGKPYDMGIGSARIGWQRWADTNSPIVNGSYEKGLPLSEGFYFYLRTWKQAKSNKMYRFGLVRNGKGKLRLHKL